MFDKNDRRFNVLEYMKVLGQGRPQRREVQRGPEVLLLGGGGGGAGAAALGHRALVACFVSQPLRSIPIRCTIWPFIASSSPSSAHLPRDAAEPGTFRASLAER